MSVVGAISGKMMASLLVVAGALIGGLIIIFNQAADSQSTVNSVSNLHIAYQPSPSSRITFRVSCLANSTTGTHPNSKAICAAIARQGIRLFAPVPADTACTEIYGGPATATITGTVKGSKIYAKFSRTNGCQIARWENASALFTFPGYATIYGRIEVSPTCGGPVRPGQNCTDPSVAGQVLFNNKTHGSVKALALAESGFSVLLQRGKWRITGSTTSAMRCSPNALTVPTPNEIVLACDTGIR